MQVTASRNGGYKERNRGLMPIVYCQIDRILPKPRQLQLLNDEDERRGGT